MLFDLLDFKEYFDPDDVIAKYGEAGRLTCY
jgi:hypothetical protein